MANPGQVLHGEQRKRLKLEYNLRPYYFRIFRATLFNIKNFYRLVNKGALGNQGWHIFLS